MMNLEKSLIAFNEAKHYLVGGVNSPVRAFSSVLGHPIFIAKGRGAKVFDIDGNGYLDFVNSWGALLLGHAPNSTKKIIKKVVNNGTSFGSPTLGETDLAKKITTWMYSIEQLRLVNSGTEATMSAIRLARGYTGRNKIIKFEGCYHGHGDSFLIKAGSGALTLGRPSGPGVTKANAQDTLIANYNSLKAIKTLFYRYGDQIAAVIVEPVAGNMGLVLPKEGFLKGLREITKNWGALLIFDEVITGFRLNKGGAQEYFNVLPDLTTLGKIIGGGLPMGAYGGPREIMSKLSPEGNVYQAGTLSGNPLSVASGLAVLEEVEKNETLYQDLKKVGEKLAKGLQTNFKEKGLATIVNQIESMLWVFFGESEGIYSYGGAVKTDREFYKKYHLAHLKNKIYLPPSPFETLFISKAHQPKDIDNYLEIHRKILKEI